MFVSDICGDFIRVYPMHLLREIETRVWLLAVESEAQAKSDRDFTTTTSSVILLLEMLPISLTRQQV